MWASFRGVLSASARLACIHRYPLLRGRQVHSRHAAMGARAALIDEASPAAAAVVVLLARSCVTTAAAAERKTRLKRW